MFVRRDAISVCIRVQSGVICFPTDLNPGIKQRKATFGKVVRMETELNNFMADSTGCTGLSMKE